MATYWLVESPLLGSMKSAKGLPLYADQICLVVGLYPIGMMLGCVFALVERPSCLDHKGSMNERALGPEHIDMPHRLERLGTQDTLIGGSGQRKPDRKAGSDIVYVLGHTCIGQGSFLHR